jgi:hypothetical protein
MWIAVVAQSGPCGPGSDGARGRDVFPGIHGVGAVDQSQGSRAARCTPEIPPVGFGRGRRQVLGGVGRARLYVETPSGRGGLPEQKIEPSTSSRSSFPWAATRLAASIKVAHEVTHLRPSGRNRLSLRLGGAVLDVGGERLDAGCEVAAFPGRVDRAHKVHVLLGHRLLLQPRGF